MMVKDNVKCCNCNFDGLVDVGVEQCPECKVIGTLAWKENEDQEVIDN